MSTHKSAIRPRYSPICIAIAAALGLFSSGAAVAQQTTVPPSTPQQPVQADDAVPVDKLGEATDLEAVLVTANKRVENIREVPSSISVIGEEQLENSHVTQLSDLQAAVPGLYVNSNGSPGKTAVSLRGVSAGLSSGATVGMYLDETPLGSSGIYQAANMFALDLLPYDIGRIEVLRGPQGTLYGAGSMGGLVKFVTIRPDLVNREFRVGGGISDVSGSGDLGWNYRLGANLPLITDRVALRMSYAGNEIPGYIDNNRNGAQDINGGSQTSMRAALLWQGEGASLNLVAMRQTIDSDNNAQVALVPTTQAPLYGDLTNSVFYDERFTKDVDYFSATVDWDLGWADFVSATAYSDSTTMSRLDAGPIYGQFANLALGLPAPGQSYFDVGLDLSKVSQEFRLVSQATGPFEWMAGFFYTQESALQTQRLTLSQFNGSALPPPLAGFGTLAVIAIPSRYRETAVFTNGSYKFSDAFKVNAGLRYARNEQSFSQNSTGPVVRNGKFPGASSENVFTWSLSPQFQLSDDTMVYARVATGYQPGGPNVVVDGLPLTVNSSTMTNYELGLKSQFADRRVLFDLTGFYMDWSDIQVGTVVNGVGGLVNAGKASSRGVELSTSFQVTDSFRMGLNTAYTDAQLDDNYPTIVVPLSPTLRREIISGLAGDVLPYVPEWAWTATADYDSQLASGWSTHLGGAVRWVDSRNTGTTNVTNTYNSATVPRTLLVSTVTQPLHLDNYWALDLNASLSNEHLTFRLYAKNVTDERGYQTIGRVTSAVTAVTSHLSAAPIQPRTLGFEVDYRF